MAKEKKDNLKYKFQGTGLSVAERNAAKRAFNKYLSTYPNPSYSDLQLLEELVYRETIHERYKKKIDELNKNRYKINLSFSLPSGSYATIVVKRIFC